MARLSIFIFFICLCGFVSADSINYVKALNSEDICPLEPCLVFDDYLKESEMYFRTDSTFIFLPGIHHMKINLRLKNISRISLIGIAESVSQNISVINLVHLSKILVIDSSNITITDLIFVMSGSQNKNRIFSALLFYRSQNISIFNVVFLGGGLSNSNIIRYSTAVRCHSSLINISYSQFYNSSSLTGGGVLTYNCTVFEESNTYISNRAKSGGATSHGSSTILMTGTNHFIKNTADISGGAISCQKCVLIVEGVNYFIQNSVHDGDGGALYISDGAMGKINGRVLLERNFANTSGGGLQLFNASIDLKGNITFQSNHAGSGGGIGLAQTSTLTGIDILISNNTAEIGGGIVSYSASSIQLSRTFFKQNLAKKGGSAILVSQWSLCTLSDVDFELNNVMYGVGTIYIEQSLTFSLNGMNNFSLNRAASGSAMYLAQVSNVSLHGQNNFLYNSALTTGGAIFSYSCHLSISGNHIFIGNRAIAGGGLFSVSSVLNFYENTTSNFELNFAYHQGGAIYGLDTSIKMNGNHLFHRNWAKEEGGAIALFRMSRLVLAKYLKMHFSLNVADNVGGSIYVEDINSRSRCDKRLMDFSLNFNLCYHPSLKAMIDCGRISICFLQMEENVALTFFKNYAKSGTVLYGGQLDDCRMELLEKTAQSESVNVISPLYLFENVSTVIPLNDTVAPISSDPYRVCFCNSNGLPNCSLDMSVKTIRGREFKFSVVTVGQGNYTVPSSVRVTLDTNIRLNPNQTIQNTGYTCTDINYRLFSIDNFTTLVLYPEGPCRDVGFARREISVVFLPCPNGFMLSESECICEERLQPHTKDCSVDDNSIQRIGNLFWIGAQLSNGTYDGLIIHHGGCPLDFCKDTSTRITLDSLDRQCNYNHSGLLCSSCGENLSTTLGTLHCLPCSNSYLFLILPFALAGIALTLILLALRLTVAYGTLNGLIFYANTVQVGQSVFFPPGETNVLSVFIAWLNLDLGIEMCLYDGMNTYVYTWLQFVFPFYVWLLIAFIIVLCRYSPWLSRHLGNNPVAVFATLILLSYGKILRTIIQSLSFTSLEYPNGVYVNVWLYEGSMRYFSGSSHVALGAFAIIVLVGFFLPYTLLMLFSHNFLAYSDKWIFSWLNKIKPFLDAYHSPYKNKHRNWTGLLLLTRCVLYLSFAFNTSGNASINLAIVASVSTGLTVLVWLRGYLYIKIYNDVLEASFILNLCIFSIATYHVTGNQSGLAYASVGIAFLTFVAIIISHVFNRLKDTICFKKVSRLSANLKHKLHGSSLLMLCFKRHDEDHNSGNSNVRNAVGNKIPKQHTTSVIELHENEIVHYTPD